MDLRILLSKLGFNAYEIKIYLHLLSSGEQSASVVARKLSVPRSTVRGILDKMCEKGLVTKLFKKNIQFYYCKSPDSLLAKLEREIKQRERALEMVKESLPHLQGLFDKSKIIPRVQYYEGIHQVIEAFNNTLFTEGIEEILSITSYTFLRNPLIKRNDDEFYIPMRVKKGIKLRLIVGQTDDKAKRVGSNPKELRERRFLPPKYELPGTFYIHGDSVLYFSADKGEYMAVNIESAMMASTMKMLFEFMWEKCI